MDAYEVLERIGEGSFGRVYKGRRRLTGQTVALKYMSKIGKTEKDLAELRNEIAILRKLDHPNIILMFDCFETSKDVVLVTEYAFGELFQVLCEDKRLPEAVVQSIGKQLVSALHYLHSRRIMHRDLKPQNVLICGSSGTVKLADFGFSRQMSASTVLLSSIKGSPLYLSPELFTDHAYEYKADLWSLGVMLYELAAGEPPFYANSLHALMAIILAAEGGPKYPSYFSPAFKDFLGGLLMKDPNKRRGWPDLLHHPWITGEAEAVASAAAVVPAPIGKAAGSALPPTSSSRSASSTRGGTASKGGVAPAAVPGGIDTADGELTDPAAAISPRGRSAGTSTAAVAPRGGAGGGAGSSRSRSKSKTKGTTASGR
jgi:fused